MTTPTQVQIEAAERLIEAYRRGFEDCQKGYTREYAALTAAAEVGDKTLPQALVVDFERREQWKRDADTIERCVQTATDIANDMSIRAQDKPMKIIAAIKAMKDQP